MKLVVLFSVYIFLLICQLSQPEGLLFNAFLDELKAIFRRLPKLAQYM